MNHTLLCRSISLEIGTSNCYNRRAEPREAHVDVYGRDNAREPGRQRTQAAPLPTGAATRTATSRPRLLSPGPALRRGQRRAGHASFLPGWRCSNDEQATPPVSRADASTGTATRGLSRNPRRRLRPRLRTGTRTGTRAAPLPKDPRSSQTWSHCVWVCVGCSARCRALVFLQV